MEVAVLKSRVQLPRHRARSGRSVSGREMSERRSSRRGQCGSRDGGVVLRASSSSKSFGRSPGPAPGRCGPGDKAGNVARRHSIPRSDASPSGSFSHACFFLRGSAADADASRGQDLALVRRAGAPAHRAKGEAQSRAAGACRRKAPRPFRRLTLVRPTLSSTTSIRERHSPQLRIKAQQLRAGQAGMKAGVLRQIAERTLRRELRLHDVVTRDLHVPLVGRGQAARVFIVVLLPAPFSPTSSVISPGARNQREPAQHFLPSIALVRPVAAIIGSDLAFAAARAGLGSSRKFPSAARDRDRVSARNFRTLVRETQQPDEPGCRKAAQPPENRAASGPNRSSSRCGRSLMPSPLRSIAPGRSRDSRRHSPPSDYSLRPHRVDRMKVLREAIFGESVAVRVPIKAQANVIAAHVICLTTKSIACWKERPTALLRMTLFPSAPARPIERGCHRRVSRGCR